MGFFYADIKASPPAPKKKTGRPRDIPIASLNKMGCSVCPRDTDKGLATPKMEPDGASSPLVYILTAAPTLDEDDAGRYMSAEVNRAILKKFPKGWSKKMRYGGVIQCATDTQAIDHHERECCRGRVVDDIERTKPLVVMGIGDAALNWATGLDAYAPKFRGRLIAAKFGSHICWYYPVCYPNWFFKDQKWGKSEHELALEHDITNLVNMIEEDALPENHYFVGDRFAGIEIITGSEPGDMQRLEAALKKLAQERRAGLDIETNGLRPLMIKSPKIWMVAVGTFEHTVAFPLDHPEGWGTEFQQRRAWDLFIEYLLWSGIKECHNLAMEMEWLGHRVDTRILRMAQWADTMAMAHTVDERPGLKGLAVQTTMHFGFNVKTLSNIDAARIVEYPITQALKYNALDTKWTNKLARVYKPILAADPKLSYDYDRKVRLASTLVCCELKGLPVDLKYAYKMEESLDVQIDTLADQIQATPEVKKYTRRFGTFSPTNSDHVLQLMDKICERDEIRRGVKGGGVKMTTDEEALSEIPASEVPSAALILKHRGLEKLQSTYVRPVTSRKVICTDGKIHSKYSSMTAVTSRLAGEDPAPQNWPKRKHKEVRGIVRAEDGTWLVAADYGQIEFRVVGMASEDPNLVKYCWTGYDVHAYWAGRMIEEYPEIVDSLIERFSIDKKGDVDKIVRKTLRQEAKNMWVFPQLFGSSIHSCAAQLLIPIDIMEDLGAEFWDEFKVAKQWQEKLLKSYEKNLYVETLGGIKRRGPMTKNEIINMPIQGTAAEIVTAGMNALSERAMIEHDDDLEVILNVHDDLTGNPRDCELERVIGIYAHEMCMHRFDYINVPLLVEISVGDRWSNLKEVAVYRSDKLFNIRNPYA